MCDGPGRRQMDRYLSHARHQTTGNTTARKYDKRIRYYHLILFLSSVAAPFKNSVQFQLYQAAGNQQSWQFIELGVSRRHGVEAVQVHVPMWCSEPMPALQCRTRGTWRQTFAALAEAAQCNSSCRLSPSGSSPGPTPTVLVLAVPGPCSKHSIGGAERNRFPSSDGKRSLPTLHPKGRCGGVCRLGH